MPESNHPSRATARPRVATVRTPAGTCLLEVSICAHVSTAWSPFGGGVGGRYHEDDVQPRYLGLRLNPTSRPPPIAGLGSGQGRAPAEKTAVGILQPRHAGPESVRGGQSLG